METFQTACRIYRNATRDGMKLRRPVIRPAAGQATKLVTFVIRSNRFSFWTEAMSESNSKSPEVAKNQFLHNLSVSILCSQFRLLQAAISERVRAYKTNLQTSCTSAGRENNHVESP